MTGEPYLFLDYSVGTSVGAQPFTFPLRRLATSVEASDSSIQYAAAFAAHPGEPAYPAEVLDLLVPSTWTFDLYYDGGVVYSTEIKSGEREVEETVTETPWDSSLWFQAQGVEFGIATVVKTISGLDTFEPITFRAAIDFPIRFYDTINEVEYWQLAFGHRVEEAFPGSLSETVPVEYIGETFFSAASAFKIAISRTDLP